MKVDLVRVIKGVNVYSYQPVAAAWLDLGKLKGTESRDAADFNARLLERMPGLRKHFCCAGEPGGFVRILHNGTHFNHVVEHIAIEILAQAGLAPRDRRICSKDEKNDSLAVIETTAVETARYVMPAAADFAEAILHEKTFAVDEKVIEAKKINADAELGPGGRAIVEAAEKRGIPWSRENEDNLIRLGHGKNLRFVQEEIPDQTSRIHVDPVSDKEKGDAIVEMLYPNGQTGRIPIIAITGTNGKTTVTRMISHILADENLCVGMTTSSGIYLKGKLLASGDTTGPASAQTILGDKTVDIAVLETARGGILKRGLGWDWADVGVVTNITEDHIGQDGIESIADLVKIKSLIAERVRENGTLVLNADDTASANLNERPAVKQTKKNIVYFAAAEENPIVKAHLEKGETAYFVRDRWICEARGGSLVTRITETKAIPATMDGTADFQIQNAMAAIAAARALNISTEKITHALGKFGGAAHNRGRNNLYKVGAGYVLVDYAHNTEGFAAVSRMTRRWTGKTVTAIIALPGDRDNRIIEEAGRIAARGFDRVIISEEVNLRGRAPGEMAELLRDAIEREKPGADCETVPDEIEAFSGALARMRKNEVVVIFYRQMDLILEVLAQNQAVSVSSFEEVVNSN